MATHLDSDAVQYVCDCGRPNRINKLFFCRHCLKLRCGRCACTQVDSFFCSSCLENIPSAEAKFAANRCTKCFDCPSCQHTLTSRAAKPPAPVAVVVATPGAKTTDAASEPTATASPAPEKPEKPEKSERAERAEREALAKRKVYYLMCSACRWTSRDVGIPDRPVATGQWPDLEYAHATRFASLLEHCRNVVLHDKQAMQDWARRKAPGQQKYSSLTDRTGLTVSMARRTLGWTDKTAPKRISRPVAINPSIASDDVAPLSVDLLTQPLQLCSITTVRQRLNLPATQPHTVDALHPAHKSLSIKRSVRCGQCEHYVIKPEFNPTSIKYRIHSLASGNVPVVRLMQPLPVLKPGSNCALRVKFVNPTANDMRIALSAAAASEDDESNAAAVVVLPADGAEFVVQGRDDSTEFDGDTALPDEPAFVVWRRSNAVVVQLQVQVPASMQRSDAVVVELGLGHNYVNVYQGVSLTTATVEAATAAAATADKSGAAAGPVEHALSSRVLLRVGEVQ